MRPSDYEYRSVPAERVERSRGAGESRGVSRSTPLGLSGEDTHGYRCDDGAGKLWGILVSATFTPVFAMQAWAPTEAS